MSISWGNWDVRVYAADAWVSLAPRFAVEYPMIVDRIESILADPVPAVRLQAAQNLQVIWAAAPDRMWIMGERIATRETDTQILIAYLNCSLWNFRHLAPERCESMLSIVKRRLDDDLLHEHQGRDHLQESLGSWTAQLFVWQGRALARTWLEEWARDPEHCRDLLDSFASLLRKAFFLRYAPDADAEAHAVCDRALESLGLILTPATEISTEAYAVLASDIPEVDKDEARKRYCATEIVIHHAMNQLYFGAGVRSEDREGSLGLLNPAAKARFLIDYADILAMLARSRHPATLHHLIELYEFLIPGDPVAVFEAIHTILLGNGEEEGYHYESLGNSAVVRIVQHYIADYRYIFEDEGRRASLVVILQLFSEVGWTDALKLLYDLPDLLR